MDLLGGLRKLLGIQEQPRRQEDDALVMTQGGRVPLSSVDPGQQWQQLQGAPQYDNSQRSFTPGITGAVNPLAGRDFNGRGIRYSPGEGPAYPDVPQPWQTLGKPQTTKLNIEELLRRR